MMPTKNGGFLGRNVAPIVAIMVTVFGFAYLFVEAWYPLKNAAAVVALIAAIVGYYYGSSPGSHAKDSLIAKLSKPEE